MPPDGRSMWSQLAWHRRHAWAEARAGARQPLWRWLGACASLAGWVGSSGLLAALFLAGLALEARRGSMLWGLAALAMVAAMFPWGLAGEARRMILTRLGRDPAYMGRCAARDALFHAQDQSKAIAAELPPAKPGQGKGRARL